MLFNQKASGAMSKLIRLLARARTYWCWHCSAMGGIRFSLVATSGRTGEDEGSVVTGRARTVRFLNLRGGPLGRGPVERLARSSAQCASDRLAARTQPFSMTQLNARTISSMGTACGVNERTTRPAGKRTGGVGTVGKQHVDIVELEALQRGLCALDDASARVSRLRFSA